MDSFGIQNNLHLKRNPCKSNLLPYSSVFHLFVVPLYCKYFKHVQLCISDDFAGHDLKGHYFPIMNYALSRGDTMRDDSIMKWRNIFGR